MKVFVFDLLVYRENLDHLKADGIVTRAAEVLPMLQAHEVRTVLLAEAA